MIEKKEFLKYFQKIPIAVNNLYGDPFFPTQIDDTFQKLDQLEKYGHQGIVGIITKSEISDSNIKKLSQYNLNLVVLVSMSGLENTHEFTKGVREKTLTRCEKYHIPCIAYIRPFIPRYNTSEEQIKILFDRIRGAIAHPVAVISGLRGNDEILGRSGIKESEKKEWSYRVKIVPKNVRDAINQYGSGVLIFERTSCGVAYVLGKDHSYNPYYYSPQLARCFNCPLQKTCFNQRKLYRPIQSDIELLNMLGYRASIVYQGREELCSVQPEKRTECVSCCTGCFIVKHESIAINPDLTPNLGDISFCRHLLGGRLVHHQGTFDQQEKDIARPKNPLLKDLPIYMLNSWWSFSRNIPSCYSCTYCIVTAYDNDCKTYGSVPEETAEVLWNRIK